MTGTKILIGQIAVVFALIIGAVWLATQMTAEALGYQVALGAPWFYVGETPVYKPWRLFQWWYAYEAYAPEVFARGGLIAAPLQDTAPASRNSAISACPTPSSRRIASLSSPGIGAGEGVAVAVPE